ncbi:HAD family hydrolase [Kitasatospora viridis]|uniref:FMN phosphatase YigB (HAD superfamily) n=1 Tax=Kitasatospora viridis TaxID=281105 RepID=A0A561SE28_9ACTN|nr:HAD family hydrolase [Kitasatospora viridis]TWF73100.1 FMN phosphatase YigB (HAD superfamily) [Kitasatospora viridis]
MADHIPVPVLITDFDGTLYRGDAPIRHYAEQAAATLEAAARAELLNGVEEFLAVGAAAGPALAQAIDGWEAVAVLARAAGLDGDRLQRAFLTTRELMLDPVRCPLEVPTGYAELITELRSAGVRVVLATNSPADGLEALLHRLELPPLLDAVVSGTGKPEGLRRLLRAELPQAPERLCVVGDHWRNDIEPGVEIGAHSAYIDRFGRADGPASAVAPAVEGLLDSIRTWATAWAPLERN